MLAVIFPGQGAQERRMVDGIRHLGEFRDRYQLVCEHAGLDILQAVGNGDQEILNRNLCSSLMTLLVSTVSLDLFRERAQTKVDFLAGYSVGQWTAIYAAKMLAFEQLVEIVVERARLMDKCIESNPSAMSAVIGLSRDVLEAQLAELRADGHEIYVSNYNCLGQHSVSGTLSAIHHAEERLSKLKPKKLLRLPVSGAWHCPILKQAEHEFLIYLSTIQFQPRRLPIVDNTTGNWLPDDEGQLRTRLAAHLSESVRWEESIKMLIGKGCTQFVEIGFGNMLSKFGFFIDRGVKFGSYYN
jgi:[acyl-carrier-protein] S-malonyltransferase